MDSLRTVRGLVRRLDGFQRRQPVAGFPIGLVYKYFDDQGAYLAAVLTYYAFVSIFPILLIAGSVLGFLLQGNPDLQHDLLNSALSQFPIVGDQLGRPEGLQGSTSAVIIGSLTAIYGILGLGQAAQNTLSTVWAIPRNSRFNPVIGRVRSAVGLALAGLSVVLISTASSLASNLTSLNIDGQTWFAWLLHVLTITVTAVVLAFMMRISTARRPSFRGSIPGALLIAVLWHLLQIAGGTYVRHVVNKASAMNGVFALVLGLLAFIYVASVIAVLGLELNVVIDRRYWPRALLTPFTDSVEPTDADRRAYTAYAKAQRHKGFENIDVTFDK
jgi:membrane protein